jgi:hypothetical protein
MMAAVSSIPEDSLFSLFSRASPFPRAALLPYPFAHLHRRAHYRGRYVPFYEADPRSFHRGRRLFFFLFFFVFYVLTAPLGRSARTDGKPGSLKAQTIDDRSCHYIFHRVILRRPLRQRTRE